MIFRIVWWICLIFLVSMWVRVILTYVRIPPGSPLESLNKMAVTVTDPILQPVRRVLRPVAIGGAALDLSPILVSLVAVILMRFL